MDNNVYIILLTMIIVNENLNNPEERIPLFKTFLNHFQQITP